MPRRAPRSRRGPRTVRAGLAPLALAAVLAGVGPARAQEKAAAPPPRLIALGSQITCVTGPEPACVCAGEEAFQVPADLSPLAEARDLTFGLRHGCLLAADGAVLCWGDDELGQLGLPASADLERRRGHACRPTPAPVPGLPRLVALDAGWIHTCGLTAEGGVVCWGEDTLDQLGRAAEGPAPAAVEALPGPAAALSAGGFHTCALGRDGGVACWGDGSAGQLGQGKAVDASTPVAVARLPAKVTEVSAGAYHTCARLEDGGVACWGDNRFGQLGDGTRTRRTSPVRVAGLSGPATAVEAGFSFTCALVAGGSVECWGSNELGELGTGREERMAPEAAAIGPHPVQGLGRGVVRLAVAGNHACAETASGDILCWGSNEVGQLGDGTVEERPLPVPWQGRRAELPRPPPALAVAAADGTVSGVDVSYHSGKVDWSAAAAHGHRFALTLATAGNDFTDPFLATHWERMRQAGLVRGAYHFFSSADDPVEQAHHFLAHVLFEPGDLAPVVDIEKLYGPAPPDLPERLRKFLEVVEAELGVKPIIYTGPTFWKNHMSGDFGDYPLWIAEYGVEAPQVPEGWDVWHLWQWRDNVDLPEIAPVVDLNRLRSAADLDRLLIPGPAPAPDADGGSAPPPPPRRSEPPGDAGP